MMHAAITATHRSNSAVANGGATPEEYTNILWLSRRSPGGEVYDDNERRRFPSPHSHFHTSAALPLMDD